MQKPAKKLVVGNWKMKPQTLKEAKKLARLIAKDVKQYRGVEVIVCPPAIFFTELQEAAKGSKIVLGAQNCFWEQSGSFTGELSPSQLQSTGVTQVILGHSERRTMGESNAMVNKKLHAALAAKLSVIFCFGEKERDRHGHYITELREQLSRAFSQVQPPALASITIAYEPVWAIGKSGADAMKPQDVHEMVIFIRKFITEKYGAEAGRAMRILYGGSVEPTNCEALLREGYVDGFLVGHASLVAKEFIQIIAAAQKA